MAQIIEVRNREREESSTSASMICNKNTIVLEALATAMITAIQKQRDGGYRSVATHNGQRRGIDSEAVRAAVIADLEHFGRDFYPLAASTASSPLRIVLMSFSV